MSQRRRAMSGKVGMRRMLPLLATGLAIALPSVLAPAALARTSLAPASESATTLNPVGGGYTSDSLQGFARAVAGHATGDTISILVIPSAYGTAPGLQQNIQLAERRTAAVQDACQAVLPPASRVARRGCWRSSRAMTRTTATSSRQSRIRAPTASLSSEATRQSR
jgi:hypothetical protein